MLFPMAEIIRNIIDIAKLTSKLLSALRLVIPKAYCIYMPQSESYVVIFIKSNTLYNDTYLLYLMSVIWCRP